MLNTNLTDEQQMKADIDEYEFERRMSNRLCNTKSAFKNDVLSLDELCGRVDHLSNAIYRNNDNYNSITGGNFHHILMATGHITDQDLVENYCYSYDSYRHVDIMVERFIEKIGHDYQFKKTWLAYTPVKCRDEVLGILKTSYPCIKIGKIDNPTCWYEEIHKTNTKDKCYFFIDDASIDLSIDYDYLEAHK